MNSFNKVEDLQIHDGIIPFPDGEQLEYKRIFRSEAFLSYLATIVEMANTNGGCFVFGAKRKDSFAVVENLSMAGVAAFKYFEKNFLEYYHKEYVGELNPSFETKEIDGNRLAFVFVPKNSIGIISIRDGKVHYRDGNKSLRRNPSNNEYDTELDIRRNARFQEINQTPSYASLSNYYVHNELVRQQIVYKYLSIDGFVKCLEDGDILFQEPSGWNDQYESRYYKAEYRNITTSINDTPRLFAACFTREKDCEASWKVYSSGNGLKSRCIQLKIDIRALREQLCLSACKGKNDKKIKCKVYEGQVSYKLQEEAISELYKKDSPYHDIFFDSFGIEHFLELLLYKRPAYEYEKEIRFFMVPNSVSQRSDGRKVEKMKVDVSWKNLIKGVRIDKRCSASEIAVLKAICEKYGIKLDEKSKKANPDKKHNKTMRIPCKVFDIDRMKDPKRITIE